MKPGCAASLMLDQLVDGEHFIREAWKTIDGMPKPERARHLQTVRMVLAVLLEEAYAREPNAPRASFGRESLGESLG